MTAQQMPEDGGGDAGARANLAPLAPQAPQVAKQGGMRANFKDIIPVRGDNSRERRREREALHAGDFRSERKLRPPRKRGCCRCADGRSGHVRKAYASAAME